MMGKAHPTYLIEGLKLKPSRMESAYPYDYLILEFYWFGKTLRQAIIKPPLINMTSA